MTDSPSGETVADLDTQQKTVQLMFDTVIKANEHQDNKANRIISAIAFLLAASSTVLGFSLPTSGGRAVKTLFKAEYLFNTHPALFSYTVFVVLIAIGVVFYLTALGPSFNWPKQSASNDLIRDPREVSTLIFFKVVASYDSSAVLGLLRQASSNQLKERLIENFASEAVLVAEKQNAKVTFMSFGSMVFRFAVPWIIPLILSNYSTDRIFTAVSYVLALAVSILFVDIAETKPMERYKGSRPWKLYGFIALLVILAALMEWFQNRVA